MTTIELRNKIEELKELEAIIREAEAEVEVLKDELKAEMKQRETEEMNVGRYIVRWKSVVSNKLDTKALKESLPNIYDMYTKQSSGMRFTITG